MKMKNIMEILKNNKKKVIAISVGTILVASLGFYKFGYLNNGIGMSIDKKQSQIDKILLKGDYNKAYKLADVYFENESDENKKAIHKRIEECEETNTKKIEDAREIFNQVTVQVKAKAYSDKKITIYNLNDWIGDLGFKESTILNNPTDLKGTAKIKFTYKDKDDNIIATNIENIKFDENSKVKVVNEPNASVTKKTLDAECSIEELHFNKD